MKYLFTLLGMLCAPIVLFAGSNSGNLTPKQQEILLSAELNIAQTLTEANGDLLESAMAVVTDLKQNYPAEKFDRMVIPLMKILRNHKDPNFRILAALSLHELDSEAGNYAVKEAVRFDDKKIVRQICNGISK